MWHMLTRSSTEGYCYPQRGPVVTEAYLMTRGSKDQLTTPQILILLLWIIMRQVSVSNLKSVNLITLLHSLFVRYVSGYTFWVSFDKHLITSLSLWLKLDRQLLPVCQFHELCCSFYLSRFHLGLLLAAVPALGLELGEAELSEQVTGAAQQVAGEAQLPARLRRQLGAVRRQL